MRRSLAAAALLLASCATASLGPAERAGLDRALALQAQALADPRFPDVLRELDAAGEIDWIARLNPTAADQTDAYPSSLEWLLARYARGGGLAAANVAGMRSDAWFPADAAYDPADGRVRLSRASLAGDPVTLANTLVHERAHSFGLVHRGRSRAANACDAAYLAGDLAEALLRRPGESAPGDDGPVCPALCRAAERRGLWRSPACPGA